MYSLWLGLVIPLRNVLRHPRRTAIALSSVAGGIIALMIANGFVEWVFFDMRESITRAHLGHLQIVRPGYHDAGRADTTGYVLPVTGAEWDLVNRYPAIRAVAPRLAITGLVSAGETTTSFVGEAVSPDREGELSSAVNIVEGSPLAAGDSKSALFGAGLARNLGVSVGDKVVILATKASGGLNAVEVTVRGLFTTVTKAYDDAALRLPLQTAQQLVDVRGAHVWMALLDRVDRTDDVADALQARLPKNFQVVRWHELADFYNKTVALFSKQIQVVRVIIAAIIVLSISNTMMMSVTERTGEIGTLMALGIPRRRVLHSFLTEGAILGVIGGAIGVVLGTLFAYLISAAGIPMPPPPGMGHGFVAQIRITPTLASEAFVLAVFTTLLASAYPAWKASRLIVVDALRHNR
jgi:putative ABC transport system permease protein